MRSLFHEGNSNAYTNFVTQAFGLKLQHGKTVLDGIHCEPHFFTVPLDHQRPDDEKSITLFGRTLCRQDRLDDELPWLLYLQGGPGFGAPRPTASGGWIKRALQEFRVLLLDQRGTGPDHGLACPVAQARFDTAPMSLYDDEKAMATARSFVREKGQCDGMVGRYSSHLGTVIGDDFPLDHFDIVNQSLGLVGKGAEPIRLFVDSFMGAFRAERPIASRYFAVVTFMQWLVYQALPPVVCMVTLDVSTTRCLYWQKGMTKSF